MHSDHGDTTVALAAVISSVASWSTSVPVVNAQWPQWGTWPRRYYGCAGGRDLVSVFGRSVHTEGRIVDLQSVITPLFVNASTVHSLVVAAPDGTGTYRIVLRAKPIVVCICSICSDDSTMSRGAMYVDVMKAAIRCRTFCIHVIWPGERCTSIFHTRRLYTA